MDVTKAGVDKAYGIGTLWDVLGITIEEVVFVGDAVFPGGNDYPAKEAGVLGQTWIQAASSFVIATPRGAALVLV